MARTICLLFAIMLFSASASALGPLEEVKLLTENQGLAGYKASLDVWWLTPAHFLSVFGPKQPVLIARDFSGITVQVPNVEYADVKYFEGETTYYYGDTNVIVGDGPVDGASMVLGKLTTAGAESIETHLETIRGVAVYWASGIADGTIIYALHTAGRHQKSVTVESSNARFEKFILPTIRFIA